jgi:hypothetical protein
MLTIPSPVMEIFPVEGELGPRAGSYIAADQAEDPGDFCGTATAGKGESAPTNQVTLVSGFMKFQAPA